MRLVIALGSASLLPPGERPDADTQTGRLGSVGGALRTLSDTHELIVTYGTDTQLSMLAGESEADRALQRPYPLDALAAQTQGLVGYWLAGELDAGTASKPAVALLTRVLVDPYDPAFAAPTRFVGPGYRVAEARELSARHGWTVARDGVWWRRVVATPHPLAILELPVINDLLRAGNTVICAGGGGIPVARDDDGVLHGVAGIVDSDLTAALLAIELGADALVLLTGVDGVYAGYGTDHPTLLRHATVAELTAMPLARGSMQPKVAAACLFVEATGANAMIGSAGDMLHVVTGASGTVVNADDDRTDQLLSDPRGYFAQGRERAQAEVERDIATEARRRVKRH